MKIVLIFADCLTYPGKEGVSQHVFGLLEVLSKTKSISPVLLLCDRGTVSKSQLKRFNWSTILTPHSVFYDYSKVKKIIDLINPDIIQSYSIYQARLISSRYSIENKVPLLMEHHDVDEEAIAHYGSDGQTQSYQLSITKLASLNRTLSSRDMDILTKHSPTRAHTFINIPSVISSPAHDINYSAPRDPNQVLFIGNGAYPPNKRALEFICKEIAPKLPSVTFHLVGRLTEQYDALGSNVTGYGMVDDLNPIFSKVGFGIAPLDKGSGLKIKVMTYLSAGLPVVGTDVAFQGYELSPALIETGTDTFVQTLSRQIDSYAPDIHNLARKEYLKNYLNDSAINRLIDVYQNLEYDAEIDEDNSRVIHFDIKNLPWLKEFRESPYPVCSEVTYLNRRDLVAR